MYLENIVFDAYDPGRLGRFWEAALGAETLTDEVEGFETRLHHPGGPDLDLCFPRVPEPPTGPPTGPASDHLTDPPRLQLLLRDGAHPRETVDRLIGLGASRLADGLDRSPLQLCDPQRNAFAVTESSYDDGTGPIAALRLASSDPDRDSDFWAWLSGWSPAPGSAAGLRHISRRGPLLELCAESAPKGQAKNRLHLDVRLESGDDPDQVSRGIMERGGRELELEWGTLPWRVYADPSGNEFCVLPTPSDPVAH